MKSHSFLNMKIPLLPYCEITRGPSTRYSESVHITNKSTGKVLNLWLCKIRELVEVSLYNPDLRGDEKLSTIGESKKNFTENDIPIELVN